MLGIGDCQLSKLHSERVSALPYLGVTENWEKEGGKGGGKK